MQVIQKFMNNPLRNYNYIIYSDITKDAIFIEPLDLSQTHPLCKDKNLKPKYLINTHFHHDHIKDNGAFLNLPDTERVELKDQEVFYLSKEESLKTIDTPGHVEEHKCFILKDERGEFGIISGDAVFNAGVGNCKNGGDVETHFKTINFLSTELSGHLNLYPSHDFLLKNLEFAKTIEPDNQKILSLIEKRKSQDLDHEFINTTIAQEREINPFFRLEHLQKRQEYKSYSIREIFFDIRKKRDHF